MGRLVDPISAGGKAFSAENVSSDGKAALERVAKFVPAEVLSAYLAISALVEAGTDADTTGRRIGLLVAFVVGIVFTPFYLNLLADAGKPKRMHLVVGTLSFVIWSYGMRGFWDEFEIYNALVAGIGVIVFTLITGLLAPTEGSK